MRLLRFRGPVRQALLARVLIAGVLVCLSSCGGQPPGASETFQTGRVGDSSEGGPATKTAGRGRKRPYFTDILLFNGTGVWNDEVASLKALFTAHGASFHEVDSNAMDSMSTEEITKFGLLVFPGGHGGVMARSLSAETHARLREAVQFYGVSYIGFCAGAFIAVAPAPASGHDVSYGLGIVDGPELGYYYLENQLDPDIAMTMETFADGRKRDLVWYGGPVTPEVPGGVIARYPNREAAISQLWSRQGFVILSAVHPAAPQSTRDEFGLVDSDGVDFEVAWELISAAIRQQPLQAF